jgi:diguanylate cyclase (GGDEF)-like protein
MKHAGGVRLRSRISDSYLIGKALPLITCAALWLASGWGWAQSAQLTSLHAITALTNAQAAKSLPVEFQATVTFVRSSDQALFVQDGDAAIYVYWAINNSLAPGDRVLVTGKTKSSFHPVVIAESVNLVAHGALPQPVPATFDQLIRADFDCRYVTVYGVVHNAASIVKSGVRTAMLDLHTDGGDIEALISSDNSDDLDNLLDAEVLVTGSVSGRFDGKMQLTGIALYVTSLADVKVLKRAVSDPWSLPASPMDQILSAYHVSNLSKRIRVHGTITYYQPGSAAVLQDGRKSLWLMTSSVAPLHVGDVADATGFPDLHDGFLALAGARIQDRGVAAPITPNLLTWEQLSTSQYLFDLVSIEAKVVAEVRSASQDEYVLDANGNLFSAIYKRPPSEIQGTEPLLPMKHLTPGSTVRVTGVCFMNSPNPFDNRVPFNILLRSPDDIAVLAGAPWMTVGNLGRLVAILFLIVLTVSVWVWMLRRRVREQTAAITAKSEADAIQERRATQLEQWRSRILEDINSSRPLSDIVEHITEMVSFMLNGVPCWCDVNEGPRLGKPPAKKDGLRIISREVPSRSGLVLANLFAAMDTPAGNEAEETEALATGARLATLSIETRKLYSDLIHRSEFDLLTDMYNRFSLDRHLQELIDKARETSSTFGLIYVDLDDFKLVNDLYGHHIGDLYLQEVSLRMKRQLRTGDMLGRLGGDEFAALVSVARGPADVEDIAQRLERCFDAPFAMEGYVLRGSASVGMAIYPKDGTTSDSLLSAADAAMYSAKNNRRATGQSTVRKNG